MATYTTTHSQTYGTIIGQGSSRNIVNAICSIAMTTAMVDNANDEVEAFWVPKGAVITGAEFRVTDMDSSTGLVFDVGDDGDEDRLVAAFSGQAAGTIGTLAVTGLGYKYTTATKIKIYVNTASTTPVAGTVYLRLSYFVDENFTLANAVVS